MGFKEVMKKELYSYFLENLTEYCVDMKENVTVYGELFGGKINKGVHYGMDKRIRFFGMRVDGIIQSQLIA